jgi:hypothetical protein
MHRWRMLVPLALVWMALGSSLYGAPLMAKDSTLTWKEALTFLDGDPINASIASRAALERTLRRAHSGIRSTKSRPS